MGNHAKRENFFPISIASFYISLFTFGSGQVRTSKPGSSSFIPSPNSRHLKAEITRRCNLGFTIAGDTPTAVRVCLGWTRSQLRISPAWAHPPCVEDRHVTSPLNRQTHRRRFCLTVFNFSCFNSAFNSFFRALPQRPPQARARTPPAGCPRRACPIAARPPRRAATGTPRGSPRAGGLAAGKGDGAYQG